MDKDVNALASQPERLRSLHQVRTVNQLDDDEKTIK